MIVRAGHDGGCPLALAAGEGDPPPSWCTARTQALVSAFGATDVVIRGAGSMAEADASASVVDGHGCWWWAQKMRKGGSSLRVCRPQLVNFVGCTDVEVTGVTLKDPPFWYATAADHFTNALCKTVVIAGTCTCTTPLGCTFTTSASTPTSTRAAARRVRRCVPSTATESTSTPARMC